MFFIQTFTLLCYLPFHLELIFLCIEHISRTLLQFCVDNCYLNNLIDYNLTFSSLLLVFYEIILAVTCPTKTGSDLNILLLVPTPVIARYYNQHYGTNLSTLMWLFAGTFNTSNRRLRQFV